METTANKTRETIIKAYMTYVLEHNNRPSNVFSFAKHHKMKEADFYEFFSSFDAIEKEIFTLFFDQAITLLEKSEEYQMFDAQNKLLSFYFTFFEILTKNRSFVLYSLSGNKLESLNKASSLRKQFKSYINSLEIKSIDLKSDKLNNIKSKSTAEAYWGQLVFILKFWMSDNSPGFEKTDILIEKMVVTGFKLQEIEPLESLVDLGKFLLKEVKNN